MFINQDTLPSSFPTSGAPDEIKIILPKGIIGFPNLTHFKLRSLFPHRSDSFFWQLIAQDADLSFILMNISLQESPELPRYIPFDPQDLKEDLYELGILIEDVHCFFIVSIIEEENSQNITINLRAPFIYHLPTQQGWQVILHNRTYPLSFPIGG